MYTYPQKQDELIKNLNIVVRMCIYVGTVKHNINSNYFSTVLIVKYTKVPNTYVS